jgi:hypothetical protein
VANFRPIIIVGVPRSGTTLLRVLLGAHSLVLGLPETPWLLGAYGDGASLRAFLTVLADAPTGYVANVKGAQAADVFEAGRAFVEALVRPALARRGKERVVLKTPDDIRFLEFLAALFPDACYVHICRDGRDVALSYVAKKGRWFPRHDGRGGVDFFTMLRRWHAWESKARRILAGGGVSSLCLRYEDLVTRPEAEVRRLCDFLGLPFEPAMLRFAEADLDYPSWEAGSSDVRASKSISADSVGRWRQAPRTPAFVYALTRHDRYLTDLGFEPSRLAFTAPQRLAGALYPWLAPLASFIDYAAEEAKRLRGRLRLRSRILSLLERRTTPRTLGDETLSDTSP